LTNNPNGNVTINPFRLDRSKSFTCNKDHEYTAEQKAYGGVCGCTGVIYKKLVVRYLDKKNSHCIMELCSTLHNERRFLNTNYGRSTSGALNRIADVTLGGIPLIRGLINGAVLGDAGSKIDDCSGKVFDYK
jgi:phospholipase C